RQAYERPACERPLLRERPSPPRPAGLRLTTGSATLPTFSFNKIGATVGGTALDGIDSGTHRARLSSDAMTDLTNLLCMEGLLAQTPGRKQLGSRKQIVLVSALLGIDSDQVRDCQLSDSTVALG